MPRNVKRQEFSLESLKAGGRLLKAIKDKLRNENQKINYAKLRKQSFSEQMIVRLKQL